MILIHSKTPTQLIQIWTRIEPWSWYYISRLWSERETQWYWYVRSNNYIVNYSLRRRKIGQTKPAVAQNPAQFHWNNLNCRKYYISMKQILIPPYQLIFLLNMRLYQILAQTIEDDKDKLVYYFLHVQRPSLCHSLFIY